MSQSPRSTASSNNHCCIRNVYQFRNRSVDCKPPITNLLIKPNGYKIIDEILSRIVWLNRQLLGRRSKKLAALDNNQPVLFDPTFTEEEQARLDAATIKPLPPSYNMNLIQKMERVTMSHIRQS